MTALPVIPTPLQGARDMAGRGFYVAPVAQGQKAPPLVPDWENAATIDPAQIQTWALAFPDCNWLVAPGRSDYVVLDLDRKNNKDGLAELERLSVKLGFELPDTLAVTTPSGGFHLYFKGKSQSSAGRIGPGIDVRSRGGYVLAPGSTVDGKVYAIRSDIEAWEETPDAPQELLALANGHRERVAAPEGVTLDTPAIRVRAKRRLADYIKAKNVAVEGQGGDALTYAIAAEVRSLGLSPEGAFEEMQDWNDACQPPWSQDELRVKIENASRYAQNDPGAFAVPPVSDRIETEALDKLFAQAAAAESKASPRVDQQSNDASGPIPFSDLIGRSVEPVQELVQGYIERGVPTFLAGTGGSNKSRLAIQAGLSIDAGLHFLGRTVQRATFIYYSTEDDQPEVTRRIQAITRRLRLPPDGGGQYWDRVGKDSAIAIMSEGGACEPTQFSREVCDYLRSIPGHKFVVLDSCYNFVRFTGKSKLDEGAVNAFIGILQTICTECDCTMLVLWHPSQAGQERGDASGWSVAWHNAPRARLSISPVKDTDSAYELKVEKRNHGAKGKPITLYWSDGVLLPRGDTEVTEQTGRFMDAVVRVAEAAAEQGYPIQQQRKCQKWMLDEVEQDAGRRPTDRDMKEALGAAMRAGRLRYLKGTNRRVAGFYPHDARRAEELAVQAKQREASNV